MSLVICPLDRVYLVNPGCLSHICLVSILNFQSIGFDIDSALCQRVHAARPVNSNSLAFLVTGTYN
jgi:hypothetical protein